MIVNILSWVSDMLSSSLSFIKNNHQQLSNYFVIVGSIAAVIGVWMTFITLKASSENLEKQLIEQKKATSLSIVNNYISELEKHILDDTTKNILDDTTKGLKFRKILINKSQTLIDTIKFPDLTSRIIRFLGTNNFGNIFNPFHSFDPDSTEYIVYKFVDLRKVNLEDANLSDIKLETPNITCSDLSKARFMNVSLIGFSMKYSNMKDSQLIPEKKEKSQINITWSNLNNSVIGGYLDLQDSIITFSDLRNIKLHLMPGQDRAMTIAKILSKSRSLYGTLLDEDVKIELRNIMDKRIILKVKDKPNEEETEFYYVVDTPYSLIEPRIRKNVGGLTFDEQKKKKNYEVEKKSIQKWSIRGDGWKQAWIKTHKRECNF